MCYRSSRKKPMLVVKRMRKIKMLHLVTKFQSPYTEKIMCAPLLVYTYYRPFVGHTWAPRWCPFSILYTFLVFKLVNFSYWFITVTSLLNLMLRLSFVVCVIFIPICSSLLLHLYFISTSVLYLKQFSFCKTTYFTIFIVNTRVFNKINKFLLCILNTFG